jgi:Tol biopolymer transport system component
VSSSGPDISPNGRDIVYSGHTTRKHRRESFELFAFFTQGIDREARVSQVSADGFNPLWSPDGNSNSLFAVRSR